MTDETFRYLDWKIDGKPNRILKKLKILLKVGLAQEPHKACGEPAGMRNSRKLKSESAK